MKCTNGAPLADHEGMDWFLAFGAVVCSWAILRAIGGERDKRLAEIERAADHDPANPSQPRKA